MNNLISYFLLIWIITLYACASKDNEAKPITPEKKEIVFVSHRGATDTTLNQWLRINPNKRVFFFTEELDFIYKNPDVYWYTLYYDDKDNSREFFWQIVVKASSDSELALLDNHPKLNLVDFKANSDSLAITILWEKILP